MATNDDDIDDIMQELTGLLERVAQLESERRESQRDLDNLTRIVLGLRAEVQALRANIREHMGVEAAAAPARRPSQPPVERRPSRPPPEPESVAVAEPDVDPPDDFDEDYDDDDVPEVEEVDPQRTYKLERHQYPLGKSVKLPEAGALEGEKTGRRPTPVPPPLSEDTPYEGAVPPPSEGETDTRTGSYDMDATSVHIKVDEEASKPTLDPPTMDDETTGEMMVEENEDAIIESTETSEPLEILDSDLEEEDAEPATLAIDDEDAGTAPAPALKAGWADDPTSVNINLPDSEREKE